MTVESMPDCCYEAISAAVTACLDDFSDGMADPELEAHVTLSVAAAISGHECAEDQ